MKIILSIVFTFVGLSLVADCLPEISANGIDQPAYLKQAIVSGNSGKLLFNKKKVQLSRFSETPYKPVNISYEVISSSSVSPFSFRQIVCIRGQVGQKKIEGSGFVIAENGYILASKHQVKNAKHLTAYFQDGSSHAAKLLSVSESLDLALLQISFREVKPLLFDPTGLTQVGDPVIALGCPLGLSHSASQGIISAPERKLDGMRLLQTDVAINPGNSGGPLLNRSGKVAGVVVGIFQNAKGISFALPAEEARRFLGASFFKIGTLLAKENRHGDALNALLMSINFWYESAQTHSNLGEVYRRMEKYQVSEASFLNALSFDSQNANAHYNLGILYGNHLNNQKKAALHYRKYLKLHPNSVDAAEVSRWLSIAEAKQ